MKNYTIKLLLGSLTILAISNNCNAQVLFPRIDRLFKHFNFDSGYHGIKSFVPEDKIPFFGNYQRKGGIFSSFNKESEINDPPFEDSVRALLRKHSLEAHEFESRVLQFPDSETIKRLSNLKINRKQRVNSSDTDLFVKEGLVEVEIEKRKEEAFQNTPTETEDSIKCLDYKLIQAQTSLRLKNIEFERAALDYNILILEQNFRKYERQAAKSDYIFWLVILIVLSGIVFSAIQFYIGLKLHKGPVNVNVDKTLIADKDASNQPVTIKFSKDGIELKSSILGVIILVISIVFFYLYLMVVYPINDFSDHGEGHLSNIEMPQNNPNH